MVFGVLANKSRFFEIIGDSSISTRVSLEPPSKLIFSFSRVFIRIAVEVFSVV